MPEAFGRIVDHSCQQLLGTFMTTIDRLAAELRNVEASLRGGGKTHIGFHQQRKKRGNMSFTGGNGRICIQPAYDCYDVSLSGKSLTAEMGPVMRRLFKH